MKSDDFLSFISAAKIIFVLFILAVASAQDIRSRTVSDKIWIAGIFLLFPMTIFETVLIGFSYPLQIIVSSSLFLFLSSFFFYFKIFGGADCKAFLFLSVVFSIPFFEYTHPLQILFSIPISVFMNSLFFSLLFPAAYLFLNAVDFICFSEKMSLRFLCFSFISYRANICPYLFPASSFHFSFFKFLEFKYFHLRVAEKYTSFSPPRKNFIPFGIDFHDFENKKYFKELGNQISAGQISEKQRVSITIPYIVLIFFGFLYSILFGNFFCHLFFFFSSEFLYIFR